MPGRFPGSLCKLGPAWQVCVIPPALICRPGSHLGSKSCLSGIKADYFFNTRARKPEKGEKRGGKPPVPGPHRQGERLLIITLGIATGFLRKKKEK